MPFFTLEFINRNPWANNVDNLSITNSLIIFELNFKTKSIL